MGEHLNPYASSHYDMGTDAAMAPAQKPVSALVFGILHLVFGGFGLLSVPMNLVTMVLVESQTRGPNPAWDVMRDTPGYMTFYKGTIVWGLFISALLIVAGIGLLKGRPWGRTTSIVYCWIAIISAIALGAANCYFLLEPMSRLAGPAAVGAKIGAVIGMVLGPVYPIITLVFMYRRSVVAYFRQQEQRAPYG